MCCHCAIWGRLLYLTGLGISPLWLQSVMCFCTAGSITPVLEWSLWGLFISCILRIAKGPLDLVFWSPACCRLYKQVLPCLRPLTCMTETYFRSVFVVHILGRCHSSSPAFTLNFIDEYEYLLSSIYMNFSDFSVSSGLLLLSCTVRLKSPFQTCYYLFAFESFRSAFCWWMQSCCCVQVSLINSMSLFSGYGLLRAAASVGIWKLKKSPAFLRQSPWFPLQPQAAIPYLCTWASQLVLTGTFSAEASVGLLYCWCCCPQKPFFSRTVLCLCPDFNSLPQYVLARVHNLRFQSTV